MPIVPVAEWAPDTPEYLSESLTVVRNTYPRTDGSDGPLRGPGTLTAALPAVCKGAFLASAGVNSTEVVAGTTTKLYSLSGTSWTDRSGATYAVGASAMWRFAQFGSRIIATNYTDNVQTRTVGAAANFADLSASAPKAYYVATVEPGFLMLGNYFASGAATSNGVWWSGINDATSWPTPGTAAAVSAQSDNQQLPLGDSVTGILPAIGGANAAVFTERAIYRVEYQGGSIVFAFRPVDVSRGCSQPNSLVAVGQRAFFLSDEGFCVFDGTEAARIGFGRIDRFFWNDAAVGSLSSMRVTTDPLRSLIIWHYLSRAGAPRWLIYNYATNRWRFGDDAALQVEAFIERAAQTLSLTTLGQAAAAAFGFGDTRGDGAGNTRVTGGGDTRGVGWTGALNFVVGFNTSHALAGFASTPLEATVETGETDAAGKRLFVSGLRPLTNATTVTAAVGARDTFAGTVAWQTATQPAATGFCPARISTRLARARITIPAGTDWDYLQGVDVQARPEGTR